MSSDKKTIVRSILSQGILPLFYCPGQSVSLQIIRTLYQAGVRAVEYTNRGVAALENFTVIKKTLAAEAPDLYLGIGTVKTVEEAGAFIQAGADFIVSPVVNPEVAIVAEQADLLWVPGCMTPTEIFLAQRHGAPIIKLFPANILGPDFMRSIKDLFPGQLFIPTGGVEIEEENIRSWIRAGVCAVGLGSKLITHEVLNEGKVDQAKVDRLYENTLKAMKIVQAIKSENLPRS